MLHASEAVYTEPRCVEPRPIFIIGAPRSGTSITNWAIGQHPNIQPMPETAWIATYIIGAFNSFKKGSEREKFSHLSNVEFPLDKFLKQVAISIHEIVCEVYEERCSRLYGDYRKNGLKINPKNPNEAFQVRRSLSDPKERWIDGTPLNTQFAWAISQVFPEAVFLHNLRNPADVALSLENFENAGAENQSLIDGLRTWMVHTDYAWHLERALGADRVFRVDFDAIEQDSEALLREVFGFLGETYCDDCLKPFGHRPNSSKTEGKKENFLKKLENADLYCQARELYDAMAKPVSEKDHLDSIRILTERFEYHLSHRPLL